ncbi:hypothetical protein [Marinobacter sp. DUT-1]|uniref:hypothetical protein n=1 Tax=Marinobacter sp. DUT-1 TaxID=3412037 RepID=UPI003D16CDFB
MPRSGEQYTYDTWNRLQQLVYPDGEVLTYDYDVGGQMLLCNIKGRSIETQLVFTMDPFH